MFKHGLRTFATTALRSVEASTAYNVKVSKAQGFVNGLTEGRAVQSMDSPHLISISDQHVCYSNW